MVQKIALIVERADIARGGAERSMFEVAEALSARGLHVDLLAAKGQAPDANVHILCGDIPGKRVRLSRFGRALRQHLARTEYDIVHSVLPFDFADVYQPRGGTCAELILRNIATYPTPAVRLCKRLTAFTNYRRAGLLRAERRLCRGSQGPVIAALSQYVAQQLRTHYGTEPRRIVLTPNGVKTGKPVDVSQADKLREQVLSALNAAPDAPPLLCLFVAQDFRRKGLGPLIRALHAAGATRPERPVALVVVGADRSAPYRRLAQRLGVEKQIVFLGPIKEVQNILAISDVGVLPTFCDAASRSILEALAAGKPVITTRFNGAADHFADGRHGLVIDAPENIAGLAAALRYFSVATNLAQAARAIREDRLAERVSIQRVAQDLVRVYNSILEQRGRSSQADPSDKKGRVPCSGTGAGQ
jgi:UDP-glucose:(heptosyl)LPS alpha-1,3-glucosyltransferase